MKLIHRSPQGSILVTVLFMVSILALLVAAVANDSFQSMKSVAQSGRDTQAKYAAYAGMELALNALRRDEYYIGKEVISERHGRTVDEMTGLKKLQYEVLMWNNIQERGEDGSTSGGEPSDMAGPEGVIVRPDTVYIVSSGTDTLKGEQVILSSMAGTARRVRPVFEDAAFARTKLAFTGDSSLIDAWDSGGGWNKYAAGDFPGEVGGGGGGGGGGDMSPTVEDYQATLGTDASDGRTLRLLNGARLNGHYRVGPGVEAGAAYGRDAGNDGVFAVATAQVDTQIAGTEPDYGDGLSDEKAVVDTKTTEVPQFVSPFSDDDCVSAPTLNNEATVRKDSNGNVVKDKDGNAIVDPPQAVSLPPGGYTKVEVPGGQTLELTAGVYYFRDDFLVNGGTVITKGDGPVVIFCGKKATLHDATINEDGRTSGLQFCFTDNMEDDAVLTQLSNELRGIFEGSGAAVRQGTSPLGGGTSVTYASDEDDYIKNQIAPPVTGESGESKRSGFSHLKITGNTKLFGSISGNNLVTTMNGGEVFGSIMANVIKGEGAKLHQDLSLKGSNLMTAGGWKLEGVHQLR